MNQKFKTNQFSEQNTNSLENEFDAIKNKTRKNQTREVTLVYSSCCGCGCSDVKVKRIVNSDSNLQNGDRINVMDLLDTDEIL